MSCMFCCFIQMNVQMKNRIAPKKSLSQNFLVSQAYLHKIASLCIEPGMEMVEIGPGKGALTKAVLNLNSKDKLFAVEIDERMIPELNKLTESFNNFEYIIKDFLKTSIELSEKIVFGNLPYSVASKIILALLAGEVDLHTEEKNIKTFSDNDKKPKKMVFLLQKEVVDRIAAIPGNSEYGSLSVLVQAYYDVKKGPKIPPSCFFPQPKVNSQVIIMNKKEKIDTFNHEALLKLLSVAFKFKRKKIRNGLYKEFPDSARYLDVDKRPEEIEVYRYIEICKSIKL